MIRLGIIGAGHFAQVHLAALARLSDRVRVTAYARRDPGMPFPDADVLGARRVDVDDLLRDPSIDAVTVCAPPSFHAPFTEAALRAGKHVFCEKPIAMSRHDADAVIRVAKEAGRVLMVGQLTRHSPVYVAAAELIASGRLGSPVVMSAGRMHSGSGRAWRFDRDSGGVVFDLMVHDFDLMNWLVGRPTHVVARGRRHAQGGYEYASTLFLFPDGRTATIEGGFILRPPAGLRATLRWVGEHGHIEIDAQDKETPIRFCIEGEPEERLPAAPAHTPAAGVASELEEFLDTIEGHGAGRLRVEDAAWAVACAEAVIKAADTGQETAIE